MTRGPFVAAALSVVVLSIGDAGCATPDMSGVADGVTKARIRAVAVGMSEPQVVAILGEPLARESAPGFEGMLTMRYTRRPIGARVYPMLWVHEKDGRVVEVYAKQYFRWGLDDLGVYVRNDDHTWEHRDFETTFTR